MSGDRALYYIHTVHIVRRLFDALRSGTVTSFFATSFFYFYITYEFLYPMAYRAHIYPRDVLSVSLFPYTCLVIILKQQTHKWIQLLRIYRVLREKRQSNSAKNKKDHHKYCYLYEYNHNSIIICSGVANSNFRGLGL